jgi:hypothetical protein
MLRSAATLLMVSTLGVCGCVSTDSPSDLSLVLKVPHTFALTFERQYGQPGETVMAQMEFVNTGSETLWVPSRDQLDFSYNVGVGEGVVALPPSQCSGLEFKRVLPGQRITYRKGFVVPSLRQARIKVYVLQESGVKVPFEIR